MTSSPGARLSRGAQRQPNKWRRPPLELTANYRALDRAWPQAGHHTPILWPPCVRRWMDHPRREGRA